MPEIGKKTKRSGGSGDILAVLAGMDDVHTILVERPTTDVSAREIIYPEVEVWILDTLQNGLTCAQAKEMIGWVSEEDYVIAETRRKPEMKGKVSFGDDFDLVDFLGNKVQLWRNAGNRRLDLVHAKGIGQDILNDNWEFNLETIIISRTAMVTSGQNRIVGFILACQKRVGKDRVKWEKIWPEEPRLRTLVAFGGSDDLKVLRTLDNTKTRTPADAFYASGFFSSDLNGKPLTGNRRNECTRYLDVAIDLLWKRTVNPDGLFGASHKYQTNAESEDFVRRHPRLVECVGNLFLQNEERVFTKMRLYCGQCSALFYLMGCSESAADVYCAAEMPTEEMLSWDCWDQANDFWRLLTERDASLLEVPLALGRLVSSDEPDEDEKFAPPAGRKDGTPAEKRAILVKAWQAFRIGQPVTKETLRLRYSKDRYGNVILDDWPIIGGIDRGDRPEKEDGDDEDDEPQETAADMQARIDAARAAKKRANGGDVAEEIDPGRPADSNGNKRKKKSPSSAGGKEEEEDTKPQTLSEQLEAIREKHPGRLLLFRAGSIWSAYGVDAMRVASLLKLPQRLANELQRTDFPVKKLAEYLPRLVAAGHRVSLCESRGKEVEVEDAPVAGMPAPGKSAGKKGKAGAKK